MTDRSEADRVSDDLVERVARAMAIHEGFDPDLIINNDTPDCPQPLWRLYRRSARAAIAVVLEEAAKLVEIGYFSGEHAAAAIRALIPDGGSASSSS